MNIVLTGAAGFTGRHFAALATSRGHTVLPLEADLTDAAAVAAGLDALVAPRTGPARRVDAVVHLAGVAFVGHGSALDFYRVNVLGTQHLLQALRDQTLSPSAVLLASSANVYGNATHSPVAETLPPAPVNHYACSKLAMEHMARTHENALPMVVARPFNYTGVGQSPDFVMPKVLRHFMRREPVLRLGNLEVRREFNDVRWLSECYLRLLDPRHAGRTVNVCTGRSYCLQDVINLAAEMSGHQLQVNQDHAFMRPNEVHDLRGDPNLLQTLCSEVPSFSLHETVRWMLTEG